MNEDDCIDTRNTGECTSTSTSTIASTARMASASLTSAVAGKYSPP